MTRASDLAKLLTGGRTLGGTGEVIVKDIDTADGSSPKITLQTGDTDIASADVLGTIDFQAPDEGTGTDAILVAAGIEAVSEGDFSSSSNATSLVLKTGASAAAAEKVRIGSSGNVSIGTTSITTSTLGTSNKFLEVGAGTAGGSGTLVLSRDTTTDNDEVGGIRFVNVNNADDDGLDADGKMIAAVTSRMETSDSNAGDDSGGHLIFSTKPEAGSFAEAMRIDSSGQVGIGNTSPVEMLTIGTTSDSASRIQLLASTSGNSTIHFGDGAAAAAYRGYINYRHSADSLEFATAETERMRIHSDGGLSIGTTSITSNGFDSSTKVVIQNATSGGECLGLASTSTSGTSLEMVVFRDGANTQIGTIIGNASANTTSYGTSSDYRLKENVVDVDKPIEKLKKLKPKTYNMISDPDNKLDGFLAHELGEVIPNASHGVKDAVNEDGSIKPQQVDYGLITPLLTAALQEAVANIETLEARIATLESK